jgi:hypothetical protein
MDVDANSANGYQTRLFFTYADSADVWNNPGAVLFDKIEVMAQKNWSFDAGGHTDSIGTPDVNPRRFETLSFNGWDVNDGKWSAVATIAGQNCRSFAVATGGISAHFIVTIDPTIHSLSITVYDNNAALAPGFSLWANLWNGDSWQDVYLGNVALDGSGGWETHKVPVPASLYAACTDFWPGTASTDNTANENPVGKQLNIGLWAYDAQDNGTNDEGRIENAVIPISGFAVSDETVSNSGSSLPAIDVGSSTDSVGLNKIVNTWGAPTTVDGHSARALDSSIQEANFDITIPPKGGTLNFTYKDDPALNPGAYNLLVWVNEFDGGSWSDKVLGMLPLDGEGWRTVGLPIPEDMYTSWSLLTAPAIDWFDGDLTPTNGYQARVFMTYSNSAGSWNPPGAVLFDKIEMSTEKNWQFDVGSHADASGSDTGRPLEIDPADITAGKWSAVKTTGGESCRDYQVTSGGVSARFYVTIDPDSTALRIRVYDNNALLAPGFSLWVNFDDGDTWEDVYLGNVPLDGTGGWETHLVPIPAQLYAKGFDALSGGDNADTFFSWDPVGRQIPVGLWAWDDDNSSATQAGQFLATLPISSIAVTTETAASLPTTTTVTIDVGSVNDSMGTCKILPEAWSASASLLDGHSVRTLKTDQVYGQNFHITVPAEGGTLQFTYKDDPALNPGGNNLLVYLNEFDGDTWEDKVIGLLPLDGIGWRTVGLPIPKDIHTAWAALSQTNRDLLDAMDGAEGYQAYFFFTYANFSSSFNPPGAVAFDKIEMVKDKDWSFNIGDHVDSIGAARQTLYLLDADIADGKWSDIKTVGGENCREYTVSAGGLTARLVITVDESISSLQVRVYDNQPSLAPGFSLWADLGNGGSWQDVWLGNVPLMGSGGWKTYTVGIPASLYQSGFDLNPGSETWPDIFPNWAPVGRQIAVGIWAYDQDNSQTTPSGELAGTLSFSSFAVGTEAVQALPSAVGSAWLLFE